MRHLNIYLLLSIFILSSSCKKEGTDDSDDFFEQSSYEINENGNFQDFLTPAYYDTSETELRDEINKFVHFTRLEEYHHPFQNPDGDIAPYSINRGFGVGIGQGGTSQHHPAIDMHPSNSSNVVVYAAHEGIVNTYKDSSKYRHYITVTKEIKDSENISIGKLVTIYAHIDLDLDESESIQLNGTSVNKGDVISENLYSDTAGGPHLHFEVRFYRDSETGNEEAYHWQNSGVYTTQSSGIWSYGFWNPEISYGFGDPINIEIE